MDTDFLERIQNLKLMMEEGEEINVRPMQREKILEEWALSLIGKFLSSRALNQRAAENVPRSVWKMGNDLKIVDIGEGLFQFKFSIESQIKWVLDNGPWSFENQLLVLRRWEKGMTPHSVTFTTVPMWVQVWGLPFDLINEEAGRDIGRGLGRVVAVDSRALTADQAKFLRIRIEIPLDKPLRRGGPVISPEGDKTMVAFKYERLVGLCFRCGTFGHEEKVCKLPLVTVGGGNPYGEWMKAGFRGSQGNMKRSPQDYPRRREDSGRPERGGGPPSSAAEQNSNYGALVIYEAPEKSGLNVGENIIPPVKQGKPAVPDEQLMVVDSINKETDIMGVNTVSFETENQGTSLYSAPINYGTTSFSFIAEVKAKRNQRDQRTRAFPHDGELSMQPMNSQRQGKIITKKKGLRKSGVAILGGMYGEEKQSG
nr:uncharacterized protein CFP56_59889 [Quercus suber]